MELLRRLMKIAETILVHAPPLWVALGLAVGGGLGFVGMIAYNQSSGFCMKCHDARGVYLSYDPKHVSHKPVETDGASCLTCHTDKDIYVVAERFVGSLGARLTHATNAEVAQLPELDPGYDDAQCLTCHFDVLKLNDAEKLELPDKVAAIGLRFSHQRHYWVKDFPDEAAARLAELASSTEPKELDADARRAWEAAKQENEFLLRARLGRCAQCHDREAPEGGLDRAINYFALNPMRCTGCHTDAVRGTHPGTIHLALPSEETCRRCHSGTFHGRFTVFRAECEGTDRRSCTKCHPDYQPEGNDAAWSGVGIGN